jgi:hypothetical protein
VRLSYLGGTVTDRDAAITPPAGSQ